MKYQFQIDSRPDEFNDGRFDEVPQRITLYTSFNTDTWEA